MKIGMFTDSYKPFTSGVVRSVEITSTKLMEMGHEVYIFAPSYPSYEKEDTVFRFRSVPTPTYPDFAIALPFSLQIRDTIKKLSLDVIHVHSPFSLGMLGARCAGKYDLPLVFTYHTMYDRYVHYIPFARELSRKVVNRLAHNFCNRCDLVVAPSREVSNLLAENVHARVEVIPTGIDTANFSSPDFLWLRSKYKISPNVKILLYLGRLGKEKNISFLLQAYKTILEHEPGTCFVIVGDGPEKKALEEEASFLGLGSNVLFTGTMSKTRVADAYAGADIFVFASLTETQGLVLAEAKAAGLPSVAVQAMGAAETVKDGVDGFVVPLNQEQFVARVLQLLGDRKLHAKMSENALEGAKSISADYMAARLAGSYQEVVKNKKRRPFSVV